MHSQSPLSQKPCCRKEVTGNFPFKQGAKTLVAWGAPSVILALLPKCPLCVAAYVSLATGIGLTLSVAAFLRYGVIGASLLLLGFAAWRTISQSLTHRSSPTSSN